MPTDRSLIFFGKSLGKTIKKAREAKKMTQAGLAKECGVPQIVISKLETGEAIPLKKTGRKLARALGLNENEILRAIRGAESLRTNKDFFMNFRENAKVEPDEAGDDIAIEILEQLLGLTKESRKQIAEAAIAYDFFLNHTSAFFKKPKK